MQNLNNSNNSLQKVKEIAGKGYAEMHWDYYLLLEDDLQEILEYIEPCNENFQTFGPKLAKLLLSAGSEIDVAFKDLIKIRDPKALSAHDTNANMNLYRKFAHDNLRREFYAVEIGIARSQYACTPWDTWWDFSEEGDPIPKDNALPWWTAYNNVKHHRTENYNQATLGNVLEAMAALFMLIGSIARAEKRFDGYRIPKILLYCDSSLGRIWTSRFEDGAIIMGDAPSFRFEPLNLAL